MMRRTPASRAARSAFTKPSRLIESTRSGSAASRAGPLVAAAAKTTASSPATGARESDAGSTMSTWRKGTSPCSRANSGGGGARSNSTTPMPARIASAAMLSLRSPRPR